MFWLFTVLKPPTIPVIFWTWVAIVLTACGIETTLLDPVLNSFTLGCNSSYRLRYWNVYSITCYQSCISCWLQQYLPLAVLKLVVRHLSIIQPGIPISCNSAYRLRYWNNSATPAFTFSKPIRVATVLTVYGIETSYHICVCKRQLMLQQYLPFTVLKRSNKRWDDII